MAVGLYFGFIYSLRPLLLPDPGGGRGGGTATQEGRGLAVAPWGQLLTTVRCRMLSWTDPPLSAPFSMPFGSGGALIFGGKVRWAACLQGNVLLRTVSRWVEARMGMLISIDPLICFHHLKGASYLSSGICCRSPSVSEVSWM